MTLTIIIILIAYSLILTLLLIQSGARNTQILTTLEHQNDLLNDIEQTLNTERTHHDKQSPNHRNR